jgi:hypothetical protein
MGEQLDPLHRQQRRALVWWCVVPFCLVLVAMVLLAIWTGPHTPPMGAITERQRAAILATVPPRTENEAILAFTQHWCKNYR